MENRERQILSEIMDMMASIRSQLEILDEKMVQLQQAVRQEDVDETPIDLDIDDIMDGPVVPVVSAVSQDEPVEVEQVEVSVESGEVADEQVEVTENQTEVQEDQQETEDETVEIADELVEVADESVEVVEEVRQEEAVDDLPDDDLPFGDISLDEDDDLPIFADPEPVQPVVKVEQKVIYLRLAGGYEGTDINVAILGEFDHTLKAGDHIAVTAKASYRYYDYYNFFTAYLINASDISSSKADKRTCMFS